MPEFIENKYTLVDPQRVERQGFFIGLNLQPFPRPVTLADIGCRFGFNNQGELVVETPEERDERRTMKVAAPRGGDAVRLVAPWSFA